MDDPYIQSISSPVQQVYDDELPGIYTAGLHTPPRIAAPRSAALSGLGGLGITRPTFESPVAGPDLTVYDDDQTFGNIADQRTADLMKERGEPYKKFADLMAKRSADIGDAEGMNKWLAVARAGLATAAGTSPYAMANIGKGAGAGLDEYISGRKDIQARRDKNLALNVQLTGLQESLKDRMAQLGTQHARGEIDDQQYRIKAAQTNTQIENAAIEARNLSKTRLYKMELDKEQAIRASQEKVLDRESQKERQILANNADPASVKTMNRIMELDAKGDPASKKAAAGLRETLNPTLAKALKSQDSKWDKALADVAKELQPPERNDENYVTAMQEYRQLVLDAFYRHGGDTSLGKMYVITRLGGGAAPAGVNYKSQGGVKSYRKTN
jgi:hypothetical protein